MSATKNPHTSKDHWRAPNGKEYRIVDAAPGTLVMIQPTKADVKCAVKGDSRNCALAQAWKRQADVPVAQIGIDKCYLPMRLDGEIVVLRCKTTAKARRIIDAFDRGEAFPTEGIQLRGIPPADRMDARRMADKRQRERWDKIRTPARKKRRSIYIRSATHSAVQP